MKRTGFLAAIGGAIAAAALPIPKLPAVAYQGSAVVVDSLAAASMATLDALYWQTLNLEFKTPQVLFVAPDLPATAREILGSEYAA